VLGFGETIEFAGEFLRNLDKARHNLILTQPAYWPSTRFCRS
jgi:hypothetical protein